MSTNKRFFRPQYMAIAVAVLYFVLLFSTYTNYSPMWDGRTRFVRGQAYLTYFLTGRETYEGLPVTREYARYFRDYVHKYDDSPDVVDRVSDNPDFRRSIYQDDEHSLKWYTEEKEEFGHPPFSDIIAAGLNKLFYEQLGWVRDDHAYQLFAVVVSATLVGLVFYWLYSAYGYLPAVIGSIALGSSSLYWSQSHYNIKDIPLIVFFSWTIWAWYRAVDRRSIRWLFVSSLFAGASFGTKFNTVFLPFIVGPWTVWRFFASSHSHRRTYVRWLIFAPIYATIVLGIFYATWPQFWGNPIDNMAKVVGFYQEVGGSVDYNPEYRTFFNTSTYATLWIWYTTYPLVLALAVAGIIGWAKNIHKTRDALPFLWILWLFIPITRASLPNTSIFGGVRHIAEYIPALALLAGYGAYYTANLVPKRYHVLYGSLLVVLFIPYFFTLSKYHPAESAYFNSFIGGLGGAKETSLNGWGDTNGGIYKKAIDWLNEHAERDAHIVTGFSEPADFYIPALREDLIADNYFSGYLMEGEYIITLNYDTDVGHTYRMQYPRQNLAPLYTWEIGGVSYLSVYKNDEEHALPGKASSKTFTVNPTHHEDHDILFALDQEYTVDAIQMSYPDHLTNPCAEEQMVRVEASTDGTEWSVLPETYPGTAITPLGQQPTSGSLTMPIAADPIRFLSLSIIPADACIFSATSAVITVKQ